MEALYFAAVIASVALPCALWGMFERWMDHKEKRAEAEDTARQHIADLNAKNGKLLAQVAEMYDRIARLERRVTDKASQPRLLAEEIESLRS